MRDQFFKLMLVTNKSDAPLNAYLDFIANCAASGITAVQLREKRLSFNEQLKFGKELQRILRPFSVPLIVNDDLALAYELDADGLHLGQSDGDVLHARQKLGADKIIGLSIDSKAQLQTANVLPINYVGVGAIFSTSNKLNVAAIFGCSELKEMVQLSQHRIIAIGGINETNAAAVMEAGADGIAAIGAFHDASDPSAVVKSLRNIIDNEVQNV